MAIDDTQEQQVVPLDPAGSTGHGVKFMVIFLVLAALAVGEFYTVNRMSSIRDQQVIDTCNKYGIAMAFCGLRLFHH